MSAHWCKTFECLNPIQSYTFLVIDYLDPFAELAGPLWYEPETMLSTAL